MSACFPKTVFCSLVLSVALGNSLARVASAQFPAAFGGAPQNPPAMQVPGAMPTTMPGMQPVPQPGIQPGMVPQGNSFPGSQRPVNPIEGSWVVSASNGSNLFQAKLDLNPNGQLQFAMNASQNGVINQMQVAGKWRVQGGFLVIETNGETEQMPIQFDGQRLVVDIPAEGVRIGFARNPQASFVQPLAMGNAPAGDAWNGGYGAPGYYGGGYGN